MPLAAPGRPVTHDLFREGTKMVLNVTQSLDTPPPS